MITDQTASELSVTSNDRSIEYYFASDARYEKSLERNILMRYKKQNKLILIFNRISSAIIEHTNQVIFMEDDDLAVVKNGALTIHRVQPGEISGQSTIREIHELKIELQQIMKGILFKYLYIYIFIFLFIRKL